MSALDEMFQERNLALLKTCLGEKTRLRTSIGVEYEGLIHSIEPNRFSYIILQHPRIISTKKSTATHLKQKYCKFSLTEIISIKILNVNIFNSIKGQNQNSICLFNISYYFANFRLSN